MPRVRVVNAMVASVEKIVRVDDDATGLERCSEELAAHRPACRRHRIGHPDIVLCCPCLDRLATVLCARAAHVHALHALDLVVEVQVICREAVVIRLVVLCPVVAERHGGSGAVRLVNVLWVV